MDIVQYIVVGVGYIVTIATSGLIVRHFVSIVRQKASSASSEGSISSTDYDTGMVIGKCENILTITLILANAFTGLALIFTAKSIVRTEDIKKNAKYYLGGTLVNFTYSVLMGFLIRTVLVALGHPI